MIQESLPFRAESVKFVCKKNSRRSQMAEGFAKALGAGKIETNVPQILKLRWAYLNGSLKLSISA